MVCYFRIAFCTNEVFQITKHIYCNFNLNNILTHPLPSFFKTATSGDIGFILIMKSKYCRNAFVVQFQKLIA